MSSNAIDINDLERLGREQQLTANAPRVIPEEPEDENAGVALIKALANMLFSRGVE